MSDRLTIGPTLLGIAHAAFVQGVDFFFFKPEDVDHVSETIIGTFYEEGSWVQRPTAFPDVLDNESGYPAAEAWHALVRRCRITQPDFGGKWAVDRRMRQSGQFDGLLIPTSLLQDFDELLQQLATHEQVVVKPARGSGGKGVMFLSREGAGYVGRFDHRDWSMKEQELRSFYAARIGGKGYLCQKFICSQTEYGQPFDIRIHMRRGRNAEWTLVTMVARIGSGKNITSNISDGGSISDARPFLQNQFGQGARQIHAQLLKLGQEFAPAYQTLFPNRMIPALGLDIGLDESGKPWLFEANGSPYAKFVPITDAIPRIGYAIFLAENPQWRDGVHREAVTETG